MRKVALLLFAFLALAFVVAGFARGEGAVIRNNARILCLTCIGIR